MEENGGEKREESDLKKDEIKENKKEEKKISKLKELEKRYVSILKDKRSLEEFVKSLFPSDMHALIIQNNPGDYETQKLAQFFSIYKENKKKAKIILPCEKCAKLNSTISGMQTEISQKMIEIESYKKVISQVIELKNKNEELQKQIDELMKKESSKAQIQAEEIMNKIKMQSKSSTNTIIQKDAMHLKMVEQEDTLNMLKQDIVKYSARIHQYESEMALKRANTQAETCQTDLENQSQTLLEEIKLMHQKEKNMLVKEIENQKSEFQNYKRKIQKLLFEREEEIKKIRTNYSNLIQRSKIVNSNENNGSPHEESSQRDEVKFSLKSSKMSVKDDPATNIEYLKNVFLKYLVYVSRGVNESQNMEKIMLDLLKVSKEEKEELDKVRQKKSIWSALFSKDNNKNNQNIMSAMNSSFLQQQQKNPLRGASVQNVQRNFQNSDKPPSYTKHLLIPYKQK